MRRRVIRRLSVAGAVLLVLLHGGCATQKSNGIKSETRENIPLQSDVRPMLPDQMENDTAEIRNSVFKNFQNKKKTARPGSAQAGQDHRPPAFEHTARKKPLISGQSIPASHFAEPPVNADVGDADSDGVVFNFDDADLYEVIRTVGELLQINYIVDPNVKGKVTIQTAGKLKKKDLFGIFYQILEANGLTAVREGSLYRIFPLKEAPRLLVHSRVGGKARGLRSGERMIIQIIPLRYISAQEMTKLLTPFISADGTIIAHGDSNTLLVVDKNTNVMKALKLVSTFDVDIFSNVAHRLYAVEHIDAEELVKLLKDVLTAYGKTEKSGLKLVAITRLNKVLAISPDPDTFLKMDTLIRQLDVPSDNAEPRIYVYSVKNGGAEELSTLLNQVFTGQSRDDSKKLSSKGGEDTPAKEIVPPNPFTNQKKAEKKKDRSKTPSSDVQGTGTLRGDIKITPDTIRNALIIEATPPDYRIIESILNRLDVLPRQVLIEATIAEVTLDDSTELGVEWTFSKSKKGSTGLLTATVSDAGLVYTIGLTEKWTHALSTLAKNNKVNILSAPTVLASDNKEAKINVSTKVPVATTEYQYEADTQPIFQTSIQYRDTGIILSVTPHINERGLVSMDISQEISEQSDGVEVGGKSYPSFHERNIDTSLTVRHGQTIVIGGLITETRNKGDSGVPFLKDIPGLGYLFGKKKDTLVKTELIVLLTPHVIVNLEEVDEVTKEFKEKVGIAMGKFR